MKVTKLIREYIEEQVSMVYDAKTNPYAEQANRDRQKIRDFGDTLRKQQQAAIDQFVAEMPVYDSWRDWGPFKPEPRCPDFGRARSKAMMEKERWEKENQKAKAAKIREIMLAVELGANRTELNDMIEKLTGNRPEEERT